MTMSLIGWPSNGERVHYVVTGSHTASLMRWKSSSAGGCDPVRWLRFLLFRKREALGGISGQEEQKPLVSQSRAREVDLTNTAAAGHVTTDKFLKQ